MRFILVLTTICLFAALLLGLTYSLTKERIQDQERRIEQEALVTVLPGAVNFSEEMDYYKGLDEGDKLVGYAFVGEGKGYSSVLRIMIGIDPLGNIKGIKILSQGETPGLGARIDEVAVEGTIWDVVKGKKVVKGEPWFQEQFRYKELDQVQAITGATITSQAVMDIVKARINRFLEEQL